MRAPWYSLKTGILMDLIFAILLAMLLINAVMMKFAERHMINATIRSGDVLVRALEQAAVIGHRTAGDDTDRPLPESSLASVEGMLSAAEFSDAVILRADGEVALTTGSWGDRKQGAVASARKALATGTATRDFEGTTWGVLWPGSERLTISAPLFFRGRPIGAAAVSGHLDRVYRSLRKSEKVVLLYICLNTVVLALLVGYRTSKTVIAPLRRLLRATDEYSTDDTFPTLSETPRSEIGRIFHSLNLMLKRLNANKQELQSHITSLETANREIRKAQHELIRAEKLASVGRLATGIAHEIGNPIGIILGYLELLKRGDLTDRETSDFHERIESEILRVNRIIRQLLDFSRPSSGRPEKVAVHGLFEDTLAMLEPHPMMAHTTVSLCLKAEQDTVHADPDRLTQVFVNIMMNAADAMEFVPRDGQDAREAVLTVSTHSTGDSVVIVFADTGPGVADSELARIFDPFYTTKEPGKGTGMGLSVCYRIVEELGGTISASHGTPRGLVVTVELPLLFPPSGPAK